MSYLGPSKEGYIGQAPCNALPECPKIKQQFCGSTHHLYLFPDPDHLWKCFMVQHHEKETKWGYKNARCSAQLPTCRGMVRGQYCQRTEMSHGIPRESKQMQTPRGQACYMPANNTISGKGENVSRVQTTNKFSVRASLCVCPYQHRLLNITTVLG